MPVFSISLILERISLSCIIISTFGEIFKDRLQPPLWDSKTKFLPISNFHCTWYNLNHFLVPVEISSIAHPSFSGSLSGNINITAGPGLFGREENRQSAILINIHTALTSLQGTYTDSLSPNTEPETRLLSEVTNYDLSYLGTCSRCPHLVHAHIHTWFISLGHTRATLLKI